VRLLGANAVELQGREETDDAARNLPGSLRQGLVLAKIDIRPRVNVAGDSFNEAAAVKAVEVVASDFQATRSRGRTKRFVRTSSRANWSLFLAIRQCNETSVLLNIFRGIIAHLQMDGRIGRAELRD